MIEVTLDYKELKWYNWTEKLVLYQSWQKWLSHHQVTHRFNYTSSVDTFPNTIMLYPIDAIAFKISFGM